MISDITLRVPERTRVLYEAVKVGMLQLEDLEGSCHAVCRALAEALPEPHRPKVVDGYFGERRGATHCWLVPPWDKERLIDPYPWTTTGTPLLLTVGPLSPWAPLFKMSDPWLRDRIEERDACLFDGYVEAKRRLEHLYTLVDGRLATRWFNERAR